jgi:hypothetical protein
LSTLKKFDPPAFLPDFARVPGLLDDWNKAVSHWFDVSIKAEQRMFKKKRVDATVQYFNPLKEHPQGPAIEQAITWNAFPKELLRMFGRERALVEADSLWPLSRYKRTFVGPIFDNTQYRPLNEYCEWHVFRDPSNGAIKKIAFTSEPPEYYQALFGDEVEGHQFHGDRRELLELYRELTNANVQMKDLVAAEDIVAPTGEVVLKKGSYNPYNKWNINDGIVHLAAPPNTLTAEIMLGADATVVRKNASGRILVEPEPLICCAGYGGPDRNSDPTIGSSVNALARLGAMVTLKNPVGLYMDHIDLSGWTAPDGRSVAELVKIVRGQPGMIERFEVEVPAERGFSVSDVQIGGIPIAYGGQIAECTTVKLIGIAVLAGVKPVPVGCDFQCCIDRAYATTLGRPQKIKEPLIPGTVSAFDDEGAGLHAQVKKSRASESRKAAAVELVEITGSERRRI